jgi:hypothetical protein
MRLTPEQQADIRARGICANEACDTCGKILGAVRWTIRAQSGEWCSRECRDGVAAVHEREARRAGRGCGLIRRKYATVTDRMAARRESGRARQERLRQQKSAD